MSEYYLVDVNSITPKVPRSNFKEDELETIAQSILAAGGLLSPLLLKQTGVESYEVLAGNREYYAAAKAKEIEPRIAEMVNAFIIPEELEDAAIKQFDSLHSPKSVIDPVVQQGESTLTSPSITDQRLTNLEYRLDEALRDIKQTQRQEIQRLEQQITTIQQQIPQKIEPLEIFNAATATELLQKMARAGIRGKTAEKLIQGIEKARSESPFTSFTDAQKRIDGLGETRMLKILDAWSGLY